MTWSPDDAAGPQPRPPAEQAEPRQARAGAGDQMPTLAPEHLRAARIVVADDDPAVLLLLKRLLARAGYTHVYCTQQGAQVAMLCVETDADLVIVDLRMPDRHGLEVVEEVRALSAGAVPVLVLTGEGSARMMHQALATGARDFLAKPFEPVEALLRIRNLLEVRVLHKASVAAAETRYRDLVEGSTDLICRADVAGTVTYANPAALAVLGTDVRGRRFVDLVRKDERAAVRRFYCAQLRDRVRTTVREVPVVAGGVETWLEMTVQLETDGRGAQALSAIARDVTHRRAAERLKDELISVVSHELRTPLTAIRGSLGLLAGGVMQSYPERAARMVEMALQNAERLSRLINQFLDLEKMASGQLQVERRAFPLREIVGGACDTVRPLVEKSGLWLVSEVDDLTVNVDPDRMVQVLTNLLSNAIKFSPPGGTVWVRGCERDGALELHVRDQGRGIPASKLETVFERFQQVDSSDSREKGGTGLGLPICRNLVELHGGRIWAESEPGGGTTFTAVLPGAVLHPGAEHPQAA
jgi:PAS domain S-box-containing protein